LIRRSFGKQLKSCSETQPRGNNEKTEGAGKLKVELWVPNSHRKSNERRKESMKLKAVYMSDSKRYHKFEIVGDCVGNIYVPKGTVIENLEIEMLSEGHKEHKVLKATIEERKAYYGKG
jgi:hypothetical protein